MAGSKVKVSIDDLEFVTKISSDGKEHRVLVEVWRMRGKGLRKPEMIATKALEGRTMEQALAEGVKWTQIIYDRILCVIEMNG